MAIWWLFVLTQLTAEVSARPLGLMRIMVGTAAGIRVVIGLPALLKLSEATTLKVPVFEWMPEPSTGIAVSVGAVWLVSAVLFALGWRVTLSGLLLLGSIVFVLLLDDQLYGNHLYLISWLVLLLVVADCGAALTLKGVERGVVRWPLLLLMMQASIVYGFAGISKMNADFLSGTILAAVLKDGLIQFPEALRTPQVLRVLAATAVFVELFIAVFLWFPRFRPAAFVLGLGLHTGILVFMSATGQLIVFGIVMLSLYPLFLSTERLMVIWDDTCSSCESWVKRFERIDLFQVLSAIGASDLANDLPVADVRRSLHLKHGRVTSGFGAITRILEHLVPTLWVAPILRLPGVSSLGERWYVWQAGRRSCPVGFSDDEVASSSDP